MSGARAIFEDRGGLTFLSKKIGASHSLFNLGGCDILLDVIFQKV